MLVVLQVFVWLALAGAVALTYRPTFMLSYGGSLGSDFRLAKTPGGFERWERKHVGNVEMWRVSIGTTVRESTMIREIGVQVIAERHPASGAPTTPVSESELRQAWPDVYPLISSIVDEALATTTFSISLRSFDSPEIRAISGKLLEQGGGTWRRFPSTRYTYPAAVVLFFAWCAAFAFAGMVSEAQRTYYRHVYTTSHLCPRCDYDVGIADTCPECGLDLAKERHTAATMMSRALSRRLAAPPDA